MKITLFDIPPLLIFLIRIARENDFLNGRSMVIITEKFNEFSVVTYQNISDGFG